jgi:uncharacterized membrane protein
MSSRALRGPEAEAADLIAGSDLTLLVPFAAALDAATCDEDEELEDETDCLALEARAVVVAAAFCFVLLLLLTLLLLANV